MAPCQPVTFASLGLARFLCDTCETLRLRRPTAVQAACIPVILRGRHRVIVGAAETGSGKTAAFALPLLQHWAADPCGPFALVLTPTRELAFQMAEQMAALGSGAGVRTAVVVGGMDSTQQVGALLRERPHFVIATPGRLATFAAQGVFEAAASGAYFASLRYFVLDEADRLLEPCFQKSLSQIVPLLPRERCTLMFSATMSRGMQQVQRVLEADIDAQTEVFCFDANAAASSASRLTPATQVRHRYALVPARLKCVYAAYILLFAVGDGERAVAEMLRRRRRHAEALAEDVDDIDATESAAEAVDTDDPEDADTAALPPSSAIVFAATCHRCELLHRIFRRLGLPSVSLHSRLSQFQRLAALRAFRSGNARILVATDVAARGLDIPQVQLVMHYDLPRDVTLYVHRVGRTARAGRHGRALSLVTQHDIDIVHAVEATCDVRLEAWDGPGAVDRERRVLRLLAPALKARRLAKLEMMEGGVLSAEEAEALEAFDEDPARRTDRPQHKRRWSKREAENGSAA